jgi:hypothetical protein
MLSMLAKHVMTHAEDRLNKREGWALFDADGTMEIQKTDEKGVFSSDQDAVAYVVDRALRGSIRHLRALFLNGVPSGQRVFLDGKLDGPNTKQAEQDRIYHNLRHYYKTGC